jgi:hypothetical protein
MQYSTAEVFRYVTEITNRCTKGEKSLVLLVLRRLEAGIILSMCRSDPLIMLEVSHRVVYIKNEGMRPEDGTTNFDRCLGHI